MDGSRCRKDGKVDLLHLVGKNLEGGIDHVDHAVHRSLRAVGDMNRRHVLQIDTSGVGEVRNGLWTGNYRLHGMNHMNCCSFSEEVVQEEEEVDATSYCRFRVAFSSCALSWLASVLSFLKRQEKKSRSKYYLRLVYT